MTDPASLPPLTLTSVMTDAGGVLVQIVADDDAVAVPVIAAIASEPGFRVERVRTIAELKAPTDAAAIIATEQVADGTLFDLVTILRHSGHTHLPPIIVLSPQPNLARAVSLVRAGVSDYLAFSPEVLQELPTKLREVVRWFFLDQAISIAKTEQQQIEKRLRSLQESLLTAERIARLGTWYWTLEGGSSWSDGLYRLLDLVPGAVPASLDTLLNYTHPDDRLLVEQLVTRSSHNRDASLHFRLLVGDGSVRFIEAAAHRTFDPTHNHLRPSIFLRDVTESRRFETELIAAKEAAEIASASKAEFLARMSHEIRTPMNSILGMLDLTLDTELSDEQRDYVEMSCASARSLLRLLNDVLDFSKIEAGKLTTENAPFDLHQTLQQSLRGLAQRAFDRGLELVLDLDSEVPTRLEGDAHRLTQIFVNLVGNALKFTEAGEIVVSGYLVERRGEIVTLHFAVRDTGIGISEENQSKIFEAFKQADESVTRKFGGTGLGLSICRQLITLLGGELWVESAEGQGSTFHLEIPFRQLPDSRPYMDPPAERNVLLIEDHHTTARSLEKILKSQGFVVVHAESQAAALAQLGAGVRFGLLLVDVTLSGTAPGEFLTELLLRHGPCPAIHLDPRIARSSREAAGLAVVRAHKPFTPQSVLRAIESALGAPIESSKIPSIVSPGPSAAGSLRILVAEDNPMNQIVIRTMLQRLGHDVSIVENGSLALDAINRSERFDLVLMDVQMPVLDGIETVRRLRASERGTRVPVVALTAQALAGDRDLCMKAGMDGYLTKPLDRRALEEVLRQYAATEGPKHRAQAIDRLALHERVGTRPDILTQLATMFSEDAKNLLTQVRLCIETRNQDAKGRSLHTLRGMLQNVCAAEGANCVRRLDSLVKRQLWHEAMGSLIELEREVARVASALNEDATGAPSA